jgi:hypothetical protein
VRSLLSAGKSVSLSLSAQKAKRNVDTDTQRMNDSNNNSERASDFSSKHTHKEAAARER